jgi:hypothetical protein
MKVLILGNPAETHVGKHFLSGAKAIGLDASLLDINDAFAGPRFIRSFFWHGLGRRPMRLGRFSANVVEHCRIEKPDFLLTTGIAPLSATAIQAIRSFGVVTCNFLTDDPWNVHHRAPWFMEALPFYDHVFTPRRANQPELVALSRPHIHYLPFGYAPEIHHPPGRMKDEESMAWKSEVLFIGGADDERAAMVRSLNTAGVGSSLWGGYWDRYSDLKVHAKGHADPIAFRKLVANAAVNLCLVRRANRDGHSMRSFELPAVGGCMLVEDTTEHREIFGEEGECVRFFDSPTSLVQQAQRLLADPFERQRLALAVRAKICPDDRHTYGARLRTISAICGESKGDAQASLHRPNL